jgi:hypothetical protein
LKSPFLASLPFLIAALALPAQAQPDCAPPKLLNSLPMQTVPGSNTMTIAATIESKPVKLLVDIGSRATRIWQATATRLELTGSVRQGHFRYFDLGGRYSQDGATVENLTWGSQNTGRIALNVTADPDATNAAFDGALGTAMMFPDDIDLDFAHHQLNYFAPEQCKGGGVYWDPGTITAVPTNAYEPIVLVPVTLDGLTILAQLDTGTDRTFLNPRFAEKHFALKAAALKAGNVTDAGTIIQAGVHGFSRLTFGGLTVNNPQIAIPADVGLQRRPDSIEGQRTLSDILPDMVIGMDVLAHSHLYISFHNQRVYVSAAGDGPPLTAVPAGNSRFNVLWAGNDVRLLPRRR